MCITPLMVEREIVYIDDPYKVFEALSDFESFTLCTPDNMFCSDVPGVGSETILIMGLFEITFWLLCAWFAGRKLKLYRMRKQAKHRQAQARRKTALHEE